MISYIKEFFGFRKWGKWELVNNYQNYNDYKNYSLLKRTCEKTGDIEYKRVSLLEKYSTNNLKIK